MNTVPFRCTYVQDEMIRDVKTAERVTLSFASDEPGLWVSDLVMVFRNADHFGRFERHKIYSVDVTAQ